MFNGGSPSLADIAAVTDKNNNGDGFGGNNGWWILIILFALFGWGRGGYGAGSDSGNGGGGTTVVTVPTPMGGGYGGGVNTFGFTDAAIQRGFDTQTVITKLDGINSGICSLGYDQLAQMNGINSNIMQSSFGLQQSINDNTVAGMQNTNALLTQGSDCCCRTQSAIKDVQYDMATNACAINNNVHQTGDAIINSQNQGFQMLNNTISEGFRNLEMQQMIRENNDLRQQLNNCDRDAALQGMATYVINSVRPTPVPSWQVPNPWSGCNMCYNS